MKIAFQQEQSEEGQGVTICHADDNQVEVFLSTGNQIKQYMDY